MFSIFSPLTKYLKIKKISIYNLAFILHSKFTVSILLSFSFLVSAKQLFGDPVYCITDMEKYKDYVNNYCWTMGTFIVPRPNDQTGHNVISRGVASEIGANETVNLRYYQWVVLILVFQAIAFFIPSFLWKNWEGGRMQQLCDEVSSALIEEELFQRRKDQLIKYFTTNYKDLHLCYAFKCVLCEFLNFIVCILNILAMNFIFPKFWFKYSSALNSLSTYNWDQWNQESSQLFPKITKCLYNIVGPAGGLQKFDALCLLPLNIINEKIFAFLYCWFLLLAFISSLQIIYRVATILSKKLRTLLIRAQVRGEFTNFEICRAIKRFHFGDWFVLYKVGSNVNPVLYNDLIQGLLNTEKTKKSEKSLV